ncbi:Spy/CpxP family protein refolding chaperone [Telmatospirillum sp.]|uniref:Spy/CpxP family protein refolding chaperone n=1 Tax=Telmatospirillum sp. TaxID=2079197 RepID=UPI00284D3E9A|nr:Spy/CpxP family protein refolding chaperone [Telmatospirillum sp.]MDR3441131.1 Spy/CpxP family protein refolding chaperone [Telmatospirillum sp.]
MSIRKTLILAILPVLWTTAALAQNGSSSPASAQEPQAPKSTADGNSTIWLTKQCAEHRARAVGHLAYLEARLDLTEKQRTAWHKWQQWQLDAAEKQQVDCLARVPRTDTAPTALEREALTEKVLTTRLQGLQSSRPALEALYEVLTPAQRAILDRPSHGDHFGPPPGVHRNYHDAERQPH